MTRVLVTGAAGFIGSQVAEQCLRLGMEVVATDDLSGGFRENLPAGVTYAIERLHLLVAAKNINREELAQPVAV